MKKTFVFLLLFCLIVVLTSVTAFADFGNADGADWGTNWGSDWDSDWDTGSDWADLGLFFLFDDLVWMGGGFSAVAFLFFIVVVRIILRRARDVNPHSHHAQHVKPMDYTPIDAAVTTRVKIADPDFSAEAFKTYAADVYIRAQESWEAKNLEVLRPYISDSYYNQIDAQLKEFVKQKKTNHLDGQCVMETFLTDFRQSGEYEFLTVRMRATMFDYVTSDETGAVLQGSMKERVTRFYRLEFVRTAGTKTTVEKETVAAECPNCGAPIRVTSAGICEYCKSVVTTGQYDWVLNNYALWRD